MIPLLIYRKILVYQQLAVKQNPSHFPNKWTRI